MDGGGRAMRGSAYKRPSGIVKWGWGCCVCAAVTVGRADSRVHYEQKCKQISDFYMLSAVGCLKLAYFNAENSDFGGAIS